MTDLSTRIRLERIHKIIYNTLGKYSYNEPSYKEKYMFEVEDIKINNLNLQKTKEDCIKYISGLRRVDLETRLKSYKKIRDKEINMTIEEVLLLTYRFYLLNNIIYMSDFNIDKNVYEESIDYLETYDEYLKKNKNEEQNEERKEEDKKDCIIC